jgi:hypothetical protein
MMFAIVFYIDFYLMASLPRAENAKYATGARAIAQPLVGDTTNYVLEVEAGVCHPFSEPVCASHLVYPRHG